MDCFAKWTANNPLGAYSELGAIEIETLVVLGLALLTGICIHYRKYYGTDPNDNYKHW